MNKRIIKGVGALFLSSLLLVGCGNNKNQTVATDSVKTEEQKQSSNILETSNMKVVIKDSSIVKDYKGNDILKVTYDYTNLKSEPQMFLVAASALGYQNGVELTTAVPEETNDSSSKNVQKDATLEVSMYYEISDKATPVDIEVRESFSTSGKKAAKTFNLQ